MSKKKTLKGSRDADEIKVGKDRPLIGKSKAQKRSNRQKGYQEFGQGLLDYWEGSLTSAPHAIAGVGNVLAGDFPNAVGEFGKALSKGKKSATGSFKEIGGIARVLLNLNHPEWYGKYPELLNSNLTFGTRKEYDGFEMGVGARVGITLMIPQENGNTSQAFKDAINVIYAKLRGSNSGAFNYDAVDVAAYIELVRNVIALHANLCRDIRLINNVDPYITKTPDPILAVAGYSNVQITAMKDNANDYITALNQLGRQIEALLPLPPDMSVITRSLFAATAVLEEGKGPKSSIYVYSLDKVAHVDSPHDDDIGYISLVNQPFAVKLAALRTAITEICESYQNTAYSGFTLMKIAGDMIRAYGERAFFHPQMVTSTEKVAVIYDEYALNQIQNANLACIAGGVLENADTAWDITYAIANKCAAAGFPWNVKALPGMRPRNGQFDANIIVNRSASNVSMLEAVSLTRLDYTVEHDASKDKNSDYTNFNVLDCGTDVLSSFQFYKYNNQNAVIIQGFAAITDSVPMNTVKDLISIWSQVDYAPNLYIFVQSATTPGMTPVIDLDTYAYMTYDQYKQFNNSAVLSEYKTVPIQDQANFKSAKK